MSNEMHKPFKMRPNRIIYYYKFICVANKDCSFFNLQAKGFVFLGDGCI